MAEERGGSERRWDGDGAGEGGARQRHMSDEWPSADSLAHAQEMLGEARDGAIAAPVLLAGGQPEWPGRGGSMASVRVSDTWCLFESQIADVALSMAVGGMDGGGGARWRGRVGISSSAAQLGSGIHVVVSLNSQAVKME